MFVMSVMKNTIANLKNNSITFDKSLKYDFVDNFSVSYWFFFEQQRQTKIRSRKGTDFRLYETCQEFRTDRRVKN